MKDWWQGLSSRERTLLSSLSGALALLILYFIIWTPIANSVNSLKKNVTNNRALVTWMQKATQALKANTTDRTRKTVNPAQRLAVIQQALTTTNFNKKVAQLAQTEKNNVRIVITSASFDTLTTWLTTLWLNDGIAVNALTIKRLNNQGLVSANIVLTGRKTS